jgi:uncharacterized protein YutE (UPF0331/DUF86 family)
MVDRDLLLRKIADLERYLDQLGPYGDTTLEEYVANWQMQRIVERTLHLAIETCMDVAEHIVADRKLGIPDTGAASFELLTNTGILAQDLGTSLMKMVGFRNLLVHDYARIDHARVLAIVKTDVNDLRRFRDVVLRDIV